MDIIQLIITIKNHVVLLLYSYIFLKPFHYIQVLYYRFFIHYIQSQYYYKTLMYEFDLNRRSLQFVHSVEKVII